MSHATLTLLRHGQSEWNRVGRFQGWTDVGLSPEGEVEAARVGRLLREQGYVFDSCFTSVLRRSTDTTRIVLDALSQGRVPVEESWRLNERHYGALQGLGPVSSVCRYGLQVLRCQRRFDARPPALGLDDPRFPGNDPRYCELSREELPRSESLHDTVRRMLPFWERSIVPELERGARVLVVSHKNTLRGLLKHLEGRTDADIRKIRVPTCRPIVLEFDRDLAIVGRRVLEVGHAKETGRDDRPGAR